MVISTASVENIAAGIAVDDVAAGATGQFVIAAAAVNLIIAPVAVDDVFAFSTFDMVVGVGAVECGLPSARFG